MIFIGMQLISYSVTFFGFWLVESIRLIWPPSWMRGILLYGGRV